MRRAFESWTTGWLAARQGRAIGLHALVLLAGMTAPALGQTWSPDGTQLAFAAGEDGGADVFILSRRGGLRRRVTAGAQVVGVPRWSPAGDRIAFVSDRAGEHELWVVRPDGGEPARLAAIARGTGTPRFSPDGATLLFVGSESGDHDLYLIGVDGDGLRRLTTSPGEDEVAAWSPDGETIAFRSSRGGSYQIYVLQHRRHRTRAADGGPPGEHRSGVVARWPRDRVHDRPR